MTTFISCLDSLLRGGDERREYIDALEDMVDDELWPLTKFREMLFISSTTADGFLAPLPPLNSGKSIGDAIRGFSRFLLHQAATGSKPARLCKSARIIYYPAFKNDPVL